MMISVLMHINTYDNRNDDNDDSDDNDYKHNDIFKSHLAWEPGSSLRAIIQV